MLQRQVVGAAPADGRQVQAGQAVEGQSLQHQLEAGGAQRIVGEAHRLQVVRA